MQQNSQVRKKKLKGYASWLLSIWIIWFGWCRFGFACTPLVSPTDGHQYIRQMPSFCRACPSAQPSNVGVWWWMVTFLSRFQSPKVRLVTSCGCLNLEIHCNIAKGLSWREGRGKETEKNWVLKTRFLSVGWCSIWTSNKERTPWDYESVWQLVVVGRMIIKKYIKILLTTWLSQGPQDLWQLPAALWQKLLRQYGAHGGTVELGFLGFIYYQKRLNTHGGFRFPSDFLRKNWGVLSKPKRFKGCTQRRF